MKTKIFTRLFSSLSLFSVVITPQANAQTLTMKKAKIPTTITLLTVAIILLITSARAYALSQGQQNVLREECTGYAHASRTGQSGFNQCINVVYHYWRKCVAASSQIPQTSAICLNRSIKQFGNHQGFQCRTVKRGVTTWCYFDW